MIVYLVETISDDLYDSRDEYTLGIAASVEVGKRMVIDALDEVTLHKWRTISRRITETWHMLDTEWGYSYRICPYEVAR